MKKLLTKLFVGDYKFKALGLFHSIPRPATIIFPLMVLCGYITAFVAFPLYTVTIGLISFILLLIALYFGFIHFWIWPAKWEYQDDSQKWQQGIGINMGALKNTFTPEQWEEWFDLNEKYRKFYGR